MKSPSHTAQRNLKGKKTHRLGCLCCRIINLKEEINEKFEARLASEEIKNHGRGSPPESVEI